MVVSCCVVGCTNRKDKSNRNSFYRVPKRPESRRKLWISAIGRINISGQQWEPSDHDRVCYQHFITGVKSDNESSPDYVPSVNMRYNKFKHNAKQKARWLRAETQEAEREQIEDASSLWESTSAEPEWPGPSDTSQHDRIKTEFRLERPESAHLKRPFVEMFFEESVTLSDHWLQLHTGLPSLDMFTFLLSYVNAVLPTSTVMSCKSILLCVLVKLRLNLKYQNLAQCFGVSLTTVSDIINLYLPILAQKLCFLIQWPEKDDLIRHMPNVFKALYPKCCGIIDCFKVYVQRPEHLPARAQTNYKHNTIKFLVSITPTGAISFVSKAFGGRTSDGAMTRLSGFLDKLKSGDQVMSNRGFLITEELANHGATLIIPGFSLENTPFSSSDVDQIRVRIHVEKAIERLKSFRILSTSIGLHMVPHADSIVTLCSALCNLQPTLVA